MAGFRLHNARIALGQAFKAGITVALSKAFFSRSTAVGTGNGAAPGKAQPLANALVEQKTLLTCPQVIYH